MRSTLLLTLLVLAVFGFTAALALDPITATASAASSYRLEYADSVPAKLDFIPTGAPFTNGRNGVREKENITFAFEFYGLAYTTLGIGYNGNLQWGSSNAEGLVPNGIPTSGISVAMLAWFATDLNCVQDLCGGGYGVRGVAPNREFIVRAVNWTYQVTTTTGTGDVDVDIVLHETTNVIEVRYYSVSPVPSSLYEVTIGVQQTVNNWLAVVSRNTTVDYSTYLQGRTIFFIPQQTSTASSSTGSSSVRPDIVAVTSTESWYSIQTADSVPAKVSFSNSGSAFTSGSNGVRENQAIGFSFEFFGVAYDHVGIGYNGNLQWGTSSVSGLIPSGIPSTTLSIPIFAWFGADLNCVSGVGGGGYGVIGTAPFRQFVIRANSWSYQVTSSVGTGDIDIDIVLSETYNTIEVRYYTVSALPSTTYLVTVGMQNGGASDWLAVLNRTTNFDVANFLQGRTILFAPASL